MQRGRAAGPPCQDAVYYTAHLAGVVKSENADDLRFGGNGSDVVQNGSLPEERFLARRVNRAVSF